MAALLAIAFILFAIIGRVLIQYYTTGNHGIRLADPHRDPVAATAGGTFVVSFLVGLVIVALDCWGFWTVPRWQSAYFNEAALALGLIGVALVIAAQLQMGRAWRIGVDPDEQTRLVTHGMYRRSRNPIYFGLGLYWAGLCVLLPHPGIWLAAALCWISIEVIVRKVEEPYLRQLHGTAYKAYMQRTNRYWLW